MDPRDYARAQKEYYRAWKNQQRDYWRANRDQWRTQRDQWRDQHNTWYGRRRSLVGPVILITIGIIFLLVETGHMEAWRAWAWFGHWWPVILIAAGIGRLVEWSIDRNQPHPPRSSGFAGLIILIVIVGFVATSSNHWNWHQFGDNFNMGDSDSDMSFFHGPEHDYDSQTDAVLPAGNSIQVVSSTRGDVSITTGEAGKIHIDTHKKIYGEDESKAHREADAFMPVITNSGSVTTIRLNAKEDSTHGDMQITLPPEVVLNLLVQHGDLTVTGQHASVSADTHHGDLRFSDITGNLTVKADHGDINVSSVHGDAVLNGHYGDTNVSNITGRLTLNGDFDGDMNLRAVSGPFHFHSSRTDLDIASIVDQLTIDSGDMHGSNLTGPFRLKTRDFNVDLTNVSGDVNIANSNGDVDVVAARPLGNIMVDNRSSSIRVTLPQDAGFQLDAETEGDISNDFGIGTSTNGDHKTARGTVGNGQFKVTLTSNQDDISVRRSNGAAVPEPPRPPEPPAAPGTPRRLSTRPSAPKAPAPATGDIVNQ
jgi:DUF4097 and DUF4098 domain-containing protein YvlB